MGCRFLFVILLTNAWLNLIEITEMKLNVGKCEPEWNNVKNKKHFVWYVPQVGENEWVNDQF